FPRADQFILRLRLRFLRLVGGRTRGCEGDRSDQNRPFSSEKRKFLGSNSRIGLLTENGRISQPKPRSPAGIQTPDSLVNSRLQKFLETRDFENGLCAPEFVPGPHVVRADHSGCLVGQIYTDYN